MNRKQAGREATGERRHLATGGRHKAKPGKTPFSIGREVSAGFHAVDNKHQREKGQKKLDPPKFKSEEKFKSGAHFQP